MEFDNYIEGRSGAAWVWPTLTCLSVAALVVTVVMLAVARGRSAPTSGAGAETEDRVDVSDWHRLDPWYATPAGQQSW